MQQSNYRPLVGSQEYRAIKLLLASLCERLDARESDFFVLFKPRLSQLGVVSYSEARNLTADAAIYRLAGGFHVNPRPTAIVLFDRGPSYDLVREKIIEKQICLIDETINGFLSVADQIPIILPEGNQSAADILKAPFGQWEMDILSVVASALERRRVNLPFLVTGQVALNAFCNFRGYSHDPSNPQTDADLLICTRPPVCFPTFAIEIDGPKHYSLEHWKTKTGNELEATNKLTLSLEKDMQKNRALELAELPLLRLRVDSRKRTREILHRALTPIANAIATALDSLMVAGHISDRQAKWIDETRAAISHEIKSALKTNKRLSDLPELHDAYLTLLELTDTLRRDLSRFQKAYTDELLHGPRKTTSEPERHDDTEQNLLRDTYFADEMESLAWGKLIGRIDFFVTQRRTLYDGAVEELTFVALLPSVPKGYEIYRFSERVPFIRLFAEASPDIEMDFEQSFQRHIFELHMNALPAATKTQIRRKSREIIDVSVEMQILAIGKKAVLTLYSNKGLAGLMDRLRQRCKSIVLSSLQAQGILDVDLPDNQEGVRRSLWQWHGASSAPSWWNTSGQTIDSLDDALRLIEIIPDKSRQQILVQLKARWEEDHTILAMADIPDEHELKLQDEMGRILERFRN